jgi:hypothetical protein
MPNASLSTLTGVKYVIISSKETVTHLFKFASCGAARPGRDPDRLGMVQVRSRLSAWQLEEKYTKIDKINFFALSCGFRW